MRYKEISLNGLGKVTTRDIVNEIMKEVELLYDKDCVETAFVEDFVNNVNELFIIELIVGVPDVDIDFTLYNKNGYETLEIDLTFDRYGRTFYINTENIGDLKKLNELYKK